MAWIGRTPYFTCLHSGRGALVGDDTGAWMGNMLSRATVIADIDRRIPTAGFAIDRMKPAHLR